MALVLAILLLSVAGNPRPPVLVALLGAALLLLASVRWQIGWVALLAILVAGAEARIGHIGFGSSDVLAVEVAGIERMLDGLNPYGVGYDVSRPPGAPFAYGPLSLLWYLPFRGDPQRLETLVSIVILGALAVRGGPIGLTAYAFTPALLVTAGDGSNDTSAGLFLLIALVLAERRPIAGAALLGLAAAFKPYAAAWLPALVGFAGPTALLAFLATTVLTWGPPLVAWGPAAILASFGLAQTIHGSPYYSLGFVIQSLTRDPPPAELLHRFQLLAGAMAGTLSALRVRSYGAVVVAGLATYLLTLYTGYWATFSYLAAAAPILCWHIDGWLGLPGGRVRWPWQAAAGASSDGSLSLRPGVAARSLPSPTRSAPRPPQGGDPFPD